MSETPENQPDIEIYVKRVELPSILNWVETHFTVVDQSTVGSTLKLDLSRDESALTCTIIENAVKGGYSSIWFESDQTPWQTDEACAEDAHRFFEVEVRCSANGWQAEESDTGGWYRFTDGQKSTVNWRA